MMKAMPRQIPIRLRLTVWYVLLMAITFTAFGVFLYARFQSSLVNALDASLQITVSQPSPLLIPKKTLQKMDA